MRLFYRLVLSVLLVAGAVSNGVAAAPQWQIDPAHSRFAFEARHIYSSVYGFFQAYEGDIQFDPARPEDSSMNFTIDVNSIQTHIGKRDNHLRSPEFFAVESYPEITFVSKAVSKVADDRFDVAGTLTIKDVSEEVVLPFTFFGIMDHPTNAGKQVVGFEARLTIDRLKYHVGNGKFYQMGLVGKDVVVIVSIEALRDK